MGHLPQTRGKAWTVHLGGGKGQARDIADPVEQAARGWEHLVQEAESNGGCPKVQLCLKEVAYGESGSAQRRLPPTPRPPSSQLVTLQEEAVGLHGGGQAGHGSSQPGSILPRSVPRESQGKPRGWKAGRSHEGSHRGCEGRSAEPGAPPDPARAQARDEGKGGEPCS